MSRPVSFSLPHFYTSCAEQLEELHRHFGKLGLDPDKDLAPAHRELRSALSDGISMKVFSEVHDWSFLNIEKLIREGNRPREPKIDLIVRLTSKGNLVFEWEPTGLGAWLPDHHRFKCDETDWRLWRRIEPIAERPSNEFCFLRGFRSVLGNFESGYQSPAIQYDVRSVVTVLLKATAALYEELFHSLSYTFEVQKRFDIELVWAQVKKRGQVRPEQRLKTWTIVDVAARQDAAEKKELDQLAETTKLSTEQFLAAWAAADQKGATGPAGAPHTKHDRVTRTLKKAGYKITLGEVHRYLSLLKKHHRDLVRAAEGLSATVVNFPKLNGDGQEPRK